MERQKGNLQCSASGRWKARNPAAASLPFALKRDYLKAQSSPLAAVSFSMFDRVPVKHTRRQFNTFLATGATSLILPRTSVAAAPDKQTFTYKRVGDLEIQADVYNSMPGKRRPTVIWIHGGSADRGTS